MTAVTQKVVTLIDGGKGRGKRGGSGEGGKPADSDWTDKLTRNRDYKVEGTLHNLVTILENDDRLHELFWLNDSSNQVVMAREPEWIGSNRNTFIDADSYELAAWLQHPDRYGMKCSDDNVWKAVVAVARRHRRHPIREYLQKLEWDGVPRLDAMLVEMFGASDTRYSRQASLCFMVGAVARILWMDPKNVALGAKVDFMLVLEGVQGKKKSTSFGELFDTNWYIETMESPLGKDFYQVLQGCWCVEIGEMDAFGKADATAVKVAITRRTDKFRAPYDRVPNSFRRECVFVGTTNDDQYLKDATGGRRFLPVRASGDVDLDRIRAERDQLWAEAVKLFREGFQYWVLPDDAPAEQAARYMEDSWQPRIERWLAGDFGNEDKAAPPRLRFTAGAVSWTTTDELLEFAIGMDAGKHTKADQMRISGIMKRIGHDALPADAHDEDPTDTWAHERQRWPEGGREWRWVRVSAGKGVEAPAGRADEPDF